MKIKKLYSSVALILLLLCIIALLFGHKYLKRYFGQNNMLNYSKDVIEIQIACYDKDGHIIEINGKKDFYINNKEAIDEIMGHFNSLNLVKEDLELKTVNNNYIHIFISYDGWNDLMRNHVDEIIIYKHNLFLLDGPYPFSYTGYYMKNSEYSEILNFLSQFYSQD